jgi:thymidine phosphorylase
VLESGLAAERFARMVSLQGGPADLLEQPARYLRAAPVIRVLSAPLIDVSIGSFKKNLNKARG